MTIFMSLHQYPEAQGFLQFLQFEKKYSQHTITAYSTDLEQFFDYLISEYNTTTLTEIKTPFIRSWLAQLKNQEEALTNKSINRKISALKSFFKYLLKQNVIQQTPMSGIISPKINRRLPVFIDEKDIRKVFEHTLFADDHNGRTEKLILTLFYQTGMRLSELINLKESNIDYSYGNIKVLGKGNKERIMPVSNELLYLMKEYIAQKPVAKEPVLNVFTNEKGKSLIPKTVYNFVKKYLSAATIVEKKSPHVLRHTFATHLMNNGAEMNAVKELLGHSSLASTQVYTHLTIDKLKEVYKLAHPKA
jgi:integrase/recombinase XerC